MGASGYSGRELGRGFYFNDEEGSMRIAVIGYGKMGGQIEQTALEEGHTISAVIDPFCAGKRAHCGLTIEACIEDSQDLADADVAVDFTRPDTVLDNIKRLAALNMPAVIGTTGWYDKLDEVRGFIKEHNAALLYSANFSLGVNIFYRLAAYAARLLDGRLEYDVGGYEIHHNKKADSPSGTAKKLVEWILASMTRKSEVVWDKLESPPLPESLHFASLRIGSEPGVHALIFDSLADSIEITHRARSRGGFASGALFSAQWLITGERRGVFTMDNVLEGL